MQARFLRTLPWLLLGLALAPAPALAQPGARPNVVWIVADDLGWADLGCQGSTFHHTPRLDALAASGRRFTQAYAAAPVCSPTRAALMTGKHPARLHLTDWLPGRPDQTGQRLLRPPIRQELPLEEVTLAESLQSVGYATALIGKWHLGRPGFGPNQQGFDLNIAGDASGTPLSYFAPYAREGRTMPGLEQAPDGEYLTDRLTTEAEKFLETHRDRPFFLYLPHYTVHIPMRAKAELIAHYPPWDGTPHGKQENPIYAAMLESLDQSVGRIVDKLDALGLSRSTLLIFTSDNGGLATREGPQTPPTSNAPLREGKGWLYEGGLRVPLLMSWPGQVAPGVDDTPVWSADLTATVRELVGVERIETSDGISLARRLTNHVELEPRPLYWHYPHYSNQGGRPGGAIRDGNWKLIEFYEHGRRELFNLQRDARETNNLSESQPEKAQELAEKLDAWRRSVDAQMPTPNPDFVPNLQADNLTITLPARTAEVHGVMLRYEPLPHKDTLGFWVRPDDWASWDFTVRRPGEYTVQALIGCGAGSGGSVVEFRCGEQTLRLAVPVTGGFQKFEPQALGRLRIDQPGPHRLEVRVVSKPGAAVMDLREVKLLPIKN